MSATRADPAGVAPAGVAPTGVAQQVGEEVKAEARRLRDDVIGGARQQGEERKAAAGAYLHTVASAVSSGAEAFRRDGRDGTGALLERAADEIVHVADRIEQRGAGEILRDVEGFARRHPAVFFGSAFVLAFGAARLLKSSAPVGEPDRIPAVAGTAPGPTSIGTPPGASAGASTTGAGAKDPDATAPRDVAPRDVAPRDVAPRSATPEAAAPRTAAGVTASPAASVPRRASPGQATPAAPDPGTPTPRAGTPAAGEPASRKEVP